MIELRYSDVDEPTGAEWHEWHGSWNIDISEQVRILNDFLSYYDRYNMNNDEKFTTRIKRRLKGYEKYKDDDSYALIKIEDGIYDVFLDSIEIWAIDMLNDKCEYDEDFVDSLNYIKKQAKIIYFTRLHT